MNPAEGAVAETVNQGYLLAYVDTFKTVGLLPSDFTPTAKATSPAATKSEPAAAKKPTFTESEPVTYVTVKTCEVYDNYDGGKKTGAVVEADTEVTLNGASSNGFYRMEDGTFVEKSGVVLKDKYDAAWSVTEETPATCTEAGYVKKSNSLSGKETEETVDALGHKYEKTDVKEPTCTEDGYNTFVCSVCGDTYTEDLQTLGHEAGEPEVTVAPKTFSKGTKTTYCTVCGEVLSEETIPQTFPVPLWGVIVIAAAVAGVVAAVVVVVVKKKRK